MANTETASQSVKSVIVEPFDEELFNHARNDDYAAIYRVIADRLNGRDAEPRADATGRVMGK